MGTPEVSVIIPTYRREKPLRDTLKSLLSQNAPRREIILVDQTPEHEPETERLLAQAGQQIRHLRLETPGLPAARNAGIRLARGEIILFLDDDIYPGPDLAACHLANYADPSVGCVAGRVHAASEPDPQAYPWPDGPDIFDCNHSGPRLFVRGCNMSFRRELLLQAGLFDERYIENAVGEEEDAAFAIRRLGYRVHYDAQAWVIHLASPSGGCRTASQDPGKTPAFYRNKTYFALKNVAGGDFWRILLDSYRSRAWRKPAFLKRQAAFLTGIWQGWQVYRQAGWHLQRLPYRLGGEN